MIEIALHDHLHYQQDATTEDVGAIQKKYIP